MPIDIASGNLYEEYEDVSLPGRLELSWVRVKTREILWPLLEQVG